MTRDDATDDGTHAYRVRVAARADGARLAGFNRAMARETEGRELPSAVVQAGVDAVFADPGRGFYLVVETAGEVVGGLLVTYEWSDWRNGEFWWIQSVYVEPAHRGRGLYRRLHEAVAASALERGGVCGFRLYVERENARAQGVYARLGMRHADYLMYEQLVGDPIDD